MRRRGASATPPRGAFLPGGGQLLAAGNTWDRNPCLRTGTAHTATVTAVNNVGKLPATSGCGQRLGVLMGPAARGQELAQLLAAGGRAPGLAWDGRVR
jgi:hypothetical protein